MSAKRRRHRKVHTALHLLNQQFFEEAKQILEELLRTHPEHHEILHGMRLYYLLTNEYQEAIPYFDRAIEKAPNFTYAYFNKDEGITIETYYYLQLDRKQDAFEAFDKALEIDPDYELVRTNRKLAASLKEGETPPQSDIPLVNYY